MERGAIWNDKSIDMLFRKLEGSIKADVVVIGAGITGLTTAMLLAEAGKNVIVLEANRIGSGTSGFSSCHLTSDIDKEYQNIQSQLGEETAKIVAQSKIAAIDFIERTVKEKNIACDFRRLPGYLYTENKEDIEMIINEFHAASLAGLDVELTNSLPLPHKVKKALRFENQGELNIYQYLMGLARYINSANGKIFEDSAVNNIEEKNGFYKVKTTSGIVRAKYVIMATHTPLFINPLHLVVAPYISYLMAAKLTSSEYPVGLFWDTDEPYHYTRYYKSNNSNYIIVGGEDHKTGHENDTEERYNRLEKFIRSRFDVESIDCKWSSQYYEPADGLPYIGRTKDSKNIFVATGFSGDGLTYGTTAGMIIADLILEKENAWFKTFDSNRHNPLVSASDFIKENIDVAKKFIGDRLKSYSEELNDVKIGEGKIINFEGKRLAVSRDKDNNLYAVSSLCTHMKCIVHWNQSEASWDCPCHGSRFSMDGKVITGPATTPLAKIIVEENIKVDKKE